MAFCVLLPALSVYSQQGPIRLTVDASEAPRKVIRSRLVIPASPGRLTLFYPKWVPGTHGPVGPVTSLAGLRIVAGGRPLTWHRDVEDMYAFHVELPDGTESIEASLDLLWTARDDSPFFAGAATAQLAVINWEHYVLYPKGPAVRDLEVTATLRLPPGWKHATALPLAKESVDGLEFATVSLETLVDSPLIAGAHFRSIDLTPGVQPPHFLDIVAESAAALEVSTQQVARLSRMVAETGALFGARHYRSYRFLVTLSDEIQGFGLEHHECSDNRAQEGGFINEGQFKSLASLMTHEIVHSWNGKYRRPADLTTPDFQQPMKTELLWVYEGLTTYLGQLLTTRSGLWTNETYRGELALAAARLDYRAGRNWRPLVDTTVAAPLLYFSPWGGGSWRRGADYYHEGWLIWLEADVTIRHLTRNRRSLDDFCKKFFGGKSSPPAVVTYTMDDLVATLNEIARHDWRDFFRQRVTAINPHAPLGGIEASGWRLGYTNAVPEALTRSETDNKHTDMTYSIGLVLREDGTVSDVVPGMAADKAGIGLGMKLVAVNDRRWTPAVLREAVKQSKTDTGTIQMLVQTGDYFKPFTLDYHEGEKYPHLQRDPSKPDLLEKILAPLTPAPN
jgi:predicted metalloprotease with PDZ domain